MAGRGDEVCGPLVQGDEHHPVHVNRVLPCLLVDVDNGVGAAQVKLQDATLSIGHHLAAQGVVGAVIDEGLSLSKNWNLKFV